MSDHDYPGAPQLDLPWGCWWLIIPVCVFIVLLEAKMKYGW